MSAQQHNHSFQSKEPNFEHLEQVQIDNSGSSLIESNQGDIDVDVMGDPLSVKDVVRLFSALPRWWAAYFRLRILVGLSHDEVANLIWRDVDIEKHQITIGYPVRTIPLPYAVLEYLPARASGSDVLVLSDLRLESEDAIEREVWQSILMQAGIRYRSMSSLVSTFLCIHLSAGESVESLAQVSGFKPEFITSRYQQYITRPAFGRLLALAMHA